MKLDLSQAADLTADEIEAIQETDWYQDLNEEMWEEFVASEYDGLIDYLRAEGFLA